MAEATAVFRDVAARHRRCVWLDRSHAAGWTTIGPMIGWLEDDDVSLSYDAASRTVTRHAGSEDRVVGDDIFAVLEAQVRSGPADALWVGYFGYAARADLPAEPADGVPDAVWMRVRNWVTPDQDSPASDSPPVAAVDAGPVTDVPAYERAFETIQEHLHAGDSYEVNLTYRVQVANGADPASAYLALRAHNPAPYTGFLQHDRAGARAWLLSSSPERFASVTDDGEVDTRPIKGTVPRGRTPEEDRLLATRLANETKYRAENLMIVDLMRNDLSRVCSPGSVEVPSLMAVESYAHVHQLVSTVTGRLQPEVTTIQAVRSIFPPGSMTGAPKLRTMEIIAEVESSARGVYSGVFGCLAPDGRADLGVVIRTLVTTGDGEWTLGTGGGITVLSDVAEELAESQAKAAALFASLAASDRAPSGTG
jgi:para-aminobenzoate synthetase